MKKKNCYIFCFPPSPPERAGVRLNLQIIFFLLLYCFSINISAQKPKEKSKIARAVSFNVQYAAQFPIGEFAKRFGFHNALGGNVYLKNSHNYIFSVDGNFIFGNTVKADSAILDHITTGDGDVINNNGQIIQPILSMRGVNFSLNAGKIIPVSVKEKNTGFFISTGVGYIQHKIRIDVAGNGADQLASSYKIGYDRLHSGVLLTQFIGWHSMPHKLRKLNFYLGITFAEAFTKNRRGFNYDTGKVDNKQNRDMYYGLKFCVMLPHYLQSKNKDDEYYYH